MPLEISQNQNPPCSSKAMPSRLPRTVSRQVLKISKAGDSTTSLDNLCQFSITCTIKCFPMFRQNLLCSVYAHCLLSLDTTENKAIFNLPVCSSSPYFTIFSMRILHKPVSKNLTEVQEGSTHCFSLIFQVSLVHELTKLKDRV